MNRLCRNACCRWWNLNDKQSNGRRIEVES